MTISLLSRRLLSSSALLAGALFLTVPSACNSVPVFTEGGSAGVGDGGECRDSEDCAGSRFCSSFDECVRECATCGNECDRTADCPEGQYCTSEGQCQQECEPGTDDPICGDNTCSADGQCVARNTFVVGDGGAGGMSGGDDDTNKECIKAEVEFAPQIPNVVLLIDQSGSMHNRVGDFEDSVQAAIDSGDYVPWDCPDSPNGSSAADGWDNDSEVDSHWRWNVVRNVLLHPERGIVKPLEDKVRFGLTLYSSDGGDLNTELGCPVLTEVDLAFGNHQDMLDEFACSKLVRDTPTRESLTATAEKLAALDVDGPKVIVLATDGVPDTCACSDWNDNGGRPATCEDGDSANDVEYMGMDYDVAQYEQILVALEAKRIHEELGIQIEVINVGSSGLQEHLDSVAREGGAVSGASIDGRSPGALNDAFQTIIDGVRSCAIDLDGEITAGKENTGTVLLDGEPLTYNDPDGWKKNSPTQIELVGEACETIKVGEHELDIDFPCGSFTVVPR